MGAEQQSRHEGDAVDDAGREIVLEGGRANDGRVVRIGNEVARPSYPQTATVEHFLRHLIDRGLDCVPEPLGSDERDRQRLRFIPGVAPTPPYPSWAFDERLLIDVAELQRRLHAAAADYVAPSDAVWATSAGDYFPEAALGGSHTIVCHNDLGMPNVIVGEHGRAVGVIDFDYCRPVDPLFDIAVAVRHWVPFGDLDVAHDEELDRVRRFGLFCAVHELTTDRRARVVDLSIAFLVHARSNIVALAEGGNTAFRALLDTGYEATNRATVAWIEQHRSRLVGT